ncbi:MAG: SRPBCC family protein [Phycisphaerae bacterium]|nr:SRPBCC domain-containing protein [Phycisphaerales bacterium]
MTANNPNTIHIVREYDAPVQVVWDAWTDPEQVAKWWGPRGFSIKTHAKDLKPGGFWKYTMYGPDGTEFENKTVYYEVEACKKLVYDHGGSDDRPPLFRVTVLFSEIDGKTTMDMTMAMSTAEEVLAIKKIIKDAGGNSTWDRLAEYLGEHQNNRNCFVINRSFDAPPAKVFEMWIDPNHLAKWLPPAGFAVEFLEINIAEGRTTTYRMTNRKDMTFYGQFDYREIKRHSRIVYVQRFCDEKGNLAHHPAMPEFPSEFINTITFTPEGEQSTRLTLTSEPFSQATAAEVAAFKEARSSMTKGWTGSFDALEDMLATVGEAR